MFSLTASAQPPVREYFEPVDSGLRHAPPSSLAWPSPALGERQNTSTGPFFGNITAARSGAADSAAASAPPPPTGAAPG
jgi:hypothetical protein